MKSELDLRQIEVVGARGDPLKMQQLRHRLDVTAYKCAIILCDQSWLDPDLDLSNGLALSSQSDMLRLDAMVMSVQLNIRKLLEVGSFMIWELYWSQLHGYRPSRQSQERQLCRKYRNDEIRMVFSRAFLGSPISD